MRNQKLLAWPAQAGIVVLLGLLAGLSVVVGGVITHAHADSAVVSTCDEDHLNAAITAAGSGGAVTFTCSGTISIITTVTISHDLTLDGSGQTVTLDGGGTTTVLSVNSGVNFTLKNLTVAHGKATSGLGGVFGGGLFNDHGTVTISNSTFDHNSFGNGGGLDNEGGTVTISNTTFSNNPGGIDGGGLNNDKGTVSISNSIFDHNSAGFGAGLDNEGGTVTISNTTFSNNMASPLSGGGGGGLNNDNAGTVSINNGTFSNNSSAVGGGLRNDFGSTVNISNTTFSNNSAGAPGGGGGGGIFSVGMVNISNTTFNNNSSTSSGGGVLNDNGTMSVSNTTFNNNSADDSGGGLENFDTVTIINSTFINNSAGAFPGGGGLHNEFGTMSISFSTITNNTAPTVGGGLFNDPSKTTLNVKASLVANNTGGNCAGTITDQGFNLDSANTCGFSSTNHDLVNTDPQLGALADNGGPTQTQALASTSPAIEQVPAAICPATDQRGVSRSHSNEACDMGAFEVPDANVNPVLQNVPGDITVDATGSTGAMVTYTPPTASDDEAVNPVSCLPASGSTFAIGDTTVKCTATDADGNSTSGSFVVHVKGAAEQLQNLMNMVDNFHLSPQGIQTSFDSQLQTVLADLAANNTAQACSDLASFVAHVNAQSGKQLTTAQANQLLAAASHVGAALGC